MAPVRPKCKTKFFLGGVAQSGKSLSLSRCFLLLLCPTSVDGGCDEIICYVTRSRVCIQMRKRPFSFIRLRRTFHTLIAGSINCWPWRRREIEKNLVPSLRVPRPAEPPSAQVAPTACDFFVKRRVSAWPRQDDTCHVGRSCRFFRANKTFFLNKKESFVKANDVTHMAEMAMCHPNLEILWLIFTSPSSGTALCHFVFSAPAALCHFEAAKPDKPVGGRSRSPHRPKSSVVNKCDEMIAPDSSMQLVSFFGETWQTFEANNVERVVHFEVHRRVV